MHRNVLTGLLALAVLLLQPPPVRAAICEPRDALTAKLTNEYGEQQIFVGPITQPEMAFEVWASSKGTWTIFRNHGDTACIMAFGQNGKALAIVEGKDI